MTNLVASPLVGDDRLKSVGASLNATFIAYFFAQHPKGYRKVLRGHGYHRAKIFGRAVA